MSRLDTTARGASTGAFAPFPPKVTNDEGRPFRLSAPARHALILASIIATSIPSSLGAMEATDDAASPLGVVRPLPHSSADDIRAFVRQRASRSGWAGREWRCLAALVDRENRSWNPRAKNRAGSSAYGLFQILRTPHDTTLAEQWDRFRRYTVSRYGAPCAAYRHSLAMGWY